eukprot:20132-Heterococcus_DN1.PRE.2
MLTFCRASRSLSAAAAASSKASRPELLLILAVPACAGDSDTSIASTCLSEAALTAATGETPAFSFCCAAFNCKTAAADSTYNCLQTLDSAARPALTLTEPKIGRSVASQAL